MIERFNFSFAKQHGVIISHIDTALIEITHRPGINASMIAELRRAIAKPIHLKLVPDAEFVKLLTATYEHAESALDAINSLEGNVDLQALAQTIPKRQDLLDGEDDAPIIKLINAIFSQALKQGASDIHFETFEQRLIVRFRIDGILHEVLNPPRLLAPLMISRLKVMAKLDIAEKRLPQDGRISLHIASRPIDIRVSTIPTQFGERIVLRVLDKSGASLDLTKLGMSPNSEKQMGELIHKPHGVILVTGPTGSGKTTTLYAILTELNDSQRNILTVEDPIEYNLPGIGQTQVNKKIDMTFSRGLRAILRQDPDIVMVGEIRDFDTVEMAIQASLTGHLVLSTLHTNSAIGAITRLRDMGAEPFLLSTAVIGVIAQRLVRALCDACKESRALDDDEYHLLGLSREDSTIIYKAVGCDACAQTGYQGRTGIYEIVLIDDELARMIHNNASEALMRKHARQFTPSIQTDGWRKVRDGITSIEEVLRVT